VLSAIASAGGLTDFARRDSIFVLRSVNRNDGKPPVRIRFRYGALTHAERPAATFRLRSGDVVFAE
jgi:hypothetical protein